MLGYQIFITTSLIQLFIVHCFGNTFLVLPMSFYIVFAFIPDQECLFNKIYLISFFITVFIFSNLYIIHDYYIYGSGIWISNFYC